MALWIPKRPLHKASFWVSTSSPLPGSKWSQSMRLVMTAPSRYPRTLRDPKRRSNHDSAGAAACHGWVAESGGDVGSFGDAGGALVFRDPSSELICPGLCKYVRSSRSQAVGMCSFPGSLLNSLTQLGMNTCVSVW